MVDFLQMMMDDIRCQRVPMVDVQVQLWWKITRLSDAVVFGKIGDRKKEERKGGGRRIYTLDGSRVAMGEAGKAHSMSHRWKVTEAL